MTTLNLYESQDFDSDKYLLATQVVDLMTKQFNSKELSDVFPYFQIGGAEKQSKTPNDVKESLGTLTTSLEDLAKKVNAEEKVEVEDEAASNQDKQTVANKKGPICDIFLNDRNIVNTEDSGGAQKKRIKCNEISEDDLGKLLEYSKTVGVNLDNFDNVEEFCKKYIMLQMSISSRDNSYNSYNLLKEELNIERNIRGSQLPILIECDRLESEINSEKNPHQNSVYIVNTNFGPSAKKYFETKNRIETNKVFFIYALFLIEVLKLHRKGYAHLDLKPDNFCVTENSDYVDVNLIDFGNTLGPEKKNLNNKKFKMKGAGTFGYTTKTQADSALNKDLQNKQNNMSMLELQKLDKFACVRIFLYLIKNKTRNENDTIDKIAKILIINDLEKDINSFKKEETLTLKSGERLELTSIEDIKSINLEDIIKDIITIIKIENEEHSQILNDKLYENNCGVIEFNKKNIADSIDKLIRKDNPLYCESNNFTFDEKGKLKLGGGKMGSAYKTNNPVHPVCKVMPSKLFKKPREIKVVDGQDEITIRKTYPWLNQTLVGLVLMNHMNQTNNILENTGAYYTQKKELIYSSEFHNGTGYNFMKQANGDLSDILKELTIDGGDNKEHFRDIVLQVLYILRHLQKECNFVHGDLKDKNIFYIIKETKQETKQETEIQYGDKLYKGQYKYIIKIADLDKSSCDYETNGNKYRFVPKGNDLCDKAINMGEYKALEVGGVMKLGWKGIDTSCLIRHMPKTARQSIGYKRLVEMGKTFDICSVISSLFSYKKVYEAFGENSLNTFLEFIGSSLREEGVITEVGYKYLSSLKTYHQNNKYGFEETPISKLSEFFKVFKNTKLQIKMYNHLDKIIECIENSQPSVQNTDQNTEVSAQPKADQNTDQNTEVSEQPKEDTKTHTNVIQIPYTNMYKKREGPLPPPEDGEDKETYEFRNRAKHPSPFKETPQGKVPFKYTSFTSNKPLKKDEPNILVENIMEELNYLEYLIKNDKIGERYISQIPMMMRELMKEGNPSKEEIEKMREIIDISANYKIKKDVEETLKFDFEGLMDNSSIALSEENVMLNSDSADKIESDMLTFLRDFQVKKNIDENVILNENQNLLEENEMLKNEIAQLKMLNQKPFSPQNILPPQPVPQPVPQPSPEAVPEAANVQLEQEGTRDVLEDNSKKEGYSYDGLVAKDTEPQLKLTNFFKRLENKYKIVVGEQDKKQKLKEVQNMTNEQYEKYEKSIKDTLTQNPEYKKIFKDYKEKIDKLLEYYDDYKFPKYRSLIKDLRSKEKNLEYIESELLKMIKKKLDDEAELLDSKYKPRNKNDYEAKEERRAIIIKKKEIKDDMDKQGRIPKYVYEYPKKTITFKEELENAIA
jgi:hypothetical protein